MKRLITLAVSILLASPGAFSQTKPGEIYTYVEHMPEPGFSIPEYIAANLSYPADAQAAKIEGKVVLKFIVNEEGALDSIRVIRPLYPSIDLTAIDLIQKMPRWKPAMQSGKAVKVYYSLPIFFKLQEMTMDTLDVQPEPLFNLETYISQNLAYPDNIDKSLPSYGNVKIQFIINTDSTIGNVEILSSLQPSFDKEVINLVKGMPAWKPGFKNGRPITTLHTLVIPIEPIEYKKADVVPKPGYNLSKYIYENSRAPYLAAKSGTVSRVIVKFIVNVDGSISDVQIHDKGSGTKSVDDEALRVVNSMPKWKYPAKRDGEFVKVQYFIPIEFQGGKFLSYY